MHNEVLLFAAALKPNQPSAAPSISISSNGDGSDTLLPPLAASLNGSSPQLAPSSPPLLQAQRSAQGLGESGVLQGGSSGSSQRWIYTVPQGVARPQSNDTLAFLTVSSSSPFCGEATQSSGMVGLLQAKHSTAQTLCRLYKSCCRNG